MDQNSRQPLNQMPTNQEMPDSNIPNAPLGQFKSSEPKGFKKFGLILGVPILLTLLAGGSALAYFGVVVPNKPENIVAASVANLFSVDKTGADMTLALDLSGKGTALGSSVQLKSDMYYDYSDEVISFGASLSDLAVDVDEFSNIGGFDVSQLKLEKLNINTDFVLSDKEDDFYIKVNGLDNDAVDVAEAYLDAAVGSDTEVTDQERQDYRDYMNDVFGVINDQWMLFDLQDEDDVDFSEVNEILSCLRSEEITTNLSTIRSAYLSNRFLLVDESGDKETLNGDEVTHYKTRLVSEPFRGFINEIGSKLEQDDKLNQCIEDAGVVDESGEDYEPISKEDLSFDDVVFDMWIDGDKDIRRVQYKFDESGASGLVGLDMNFRSAQSIDLPSENIKTLEQMEQEIQNIDTPLFESSTTSTALDDASAGPRDAQRKNDANRLLAAVVAYASNNSGNYPSSQQEIESVVGDYMNGSFVDLNGYQYTIYYVGGDYGGTLDSSEGSLYGESIYYSDKSYCNSGLIAVDDSLSNRNTAVDVSLELSPYYYCVDNQ